MSGTAGLEAAELDVVVVKMEAAAGRLEATTLEAAAAAAAAGLEATTLENAELERPWVCAYHGR